MARRRKANLSGLVWLVSILALFGYLFPSEKKDAKSNEPSIIVRDVTTTVQSPKSAPDALPINKDITESKAAPEIIKLYVAGNKVALRDLPSLSGKVLDRMSNGFLVERLDIEGDWVKVRHSLSQQVGYVSIERLRRAPIPQEKEEAKPKEKIEKTVVISAAAIAALLVATSVADYRADRPCACPYNLDRGGRKCGKRSAYSRPGGARPLCFPSDVTSGMIAAYRNANP
jgi:hypothetical protein